MDKIKRVKWIVVHCSASRWGTVAAINDWHEQRGFSGIGYHHVIYNGYTDPSLKYLGHMDGKIVSARSEFLQGAHCYASGRNADSLGVCLVGIPRWDEYPTDEQWGALIHYCTTKCKRYGLPVTRITQHSTWDTSKPHCASIPLKELRLIVKERLEESK